MHLIWFLIIGGAAGWLAGKVIKGKGFGLLGNIVIGCIGALLGGFLFGILGISTHNLIGSLIMAFTGAIVLLYLIRLIKKSK